MIHAQAFAFSTMDFEQFVLFVSSYDHCFIRIGDDDEVFSDEDKNNNKIKVEEKKELPKKLPPAKPKPKPKVPPQKIGNAPEFIVPLVNMQVIQGNVARLDACVKSDSKVTVKWYSGDDLVTSSSFSNFTLISDGDLHSLLIPEVSLLDTDLFTCTAVNEYGEVTCSADLLVMRKYL